MSAVARTRLTLTLRKPYSGESDSVLGGQGSELIKNLPPVPESTADDGNLVENVLDSIGL